MKKIVLANRYAYHETIKEEKYLFLRDILFEMGLPNLNDIMPESYEEQTIEQKISLRSLITKFGIYIRELSQDTMDIFFNGEEIAKFNKPFSILKEDPKEIDPSKKIYLYIELDLKHPFHGEK